jgi:hypothetical protein
MATLTASDTPNLVVMSFSTLRTLIRRREPL